MTMVRRPKTISKFVAAVVMGLWASLALAQQRFSVKLNGTAGFGIDSRSQVTDFNVAGAPLPDETELGYRDLAFDVALNASGFVYHPSVLNYDLVFSYTRNSTTIDDRGLAANGLAGGGTFTFFSEREFSTALYFNWGNRDGGGSLQGPFLSRRDIIGLRGRLSFKRLPEITYNLGKGNSGDHWGGVGWDTRQQFAHVTAGRAWRGWDFRASEDYDRTATDSIVRLPDTTAQTETTINSLQGNATRTFAHRIWLNLNLRRLTYRFGRASGIGLSDNTVTAAFANMTWRHSPRLESYYSFDLSKNAFNTLALLAAVSGVPDPAPAGLQSTDSRLYSAQAGLTFRPITGLSVGGRFRYQGQNLNQSGINTPNNFISAGTTTGELRATADVAYQRHLWKLDYQGSVWLEWQRFRFLLDGSRMGNSWAISNGLSAGKEKRLRVRGTYYFTSHTLPVFFRLMETREQRFNLGLETVRFRTRLTAEAEVGRGYNRWTNSTQDLNRTRYSLTAARGNLTASLTHATDDSNQLFFGPESPLWQPWGSTGAVPIPPALLQPLMFAKTKSDALSAIWEPRRRLRVESRYLRFRYTLINGEHQEESNWQWDTNAQYEYGRFTLVGGYIRGSIGRLSYLQRENRFYFRVRFPFSIL